MKSATTEKTIHMLHRGTYPSIKRFAGKHVFVIGNEVVPIKSGKKGLDDFNRLTKKYGESPILVFVEKPGVTYILVAQ